MPKRPATQNQTDLAKARKLLSECFQLQDAAWRLIQGVEKREQVSDARTGKPDPSLRKQRRAKR